MPLQLCKDILNVSTGPKQCLHGPVLLQCLISPRPQSDIQHSTLKWLLQHLCCPHCSSKVELFLHYLVLLHGSTTVRLNHHVTNSWSRCVHDGIFTFYHEIKLLQIDIRVIVLASRAYAPVFSETFFKMLENSDKMFHAYMLTFYMLTKSFHENPTFFVSCVKG